MKKPINSQTYSDQLLLTYAPEFIVIDISNLELSDLKIRLMKQYGLDKIDIVFDRLLKQCLETDQLADIEEVIFSYLDRNSVNERVSIILDWESEELEDFINEICQIVISIDSVLSDHVSEPWMYRLSRYDPRLLELTYRRSFTETIDV